MRSPSTACYTCKTRRIKCDGARPTCQRCAKSHRLCLDGSAASQANFSIHLENRYANGKTKRPRGPRSTMIVWQPQIDLHTKALTYYLQNHLPDGADCLAQCVYTWKISGRQCSMVDLAISCLALAVYSRIFDPLVMNEASNQYSRLLRLSQRRISQVRNTQRDSQVFDVCLLASFLMGRYECATHRLGLPNRKDTLTHHTWLHHDGAIGFLKLWHDTLGHSSLATSVIKQTRRGVIRSCLLRDLPLPDWLVDGSVFGEQDMDLVYDQIWVRTVNLHHRAMSLKQNGGFNLAEVQRLNAESQELDEALQDWMSQMPNTAYYQRHTISEPDQWREEHFYSPTVYSFPATHHAALWNKYFSTSMLIKGTQLTIFDLIIYSHNSSTEGFTYQQQRDECIRHLNAMANNIASTVPFCLQRFKVTPKLDRPTTDRSSITLHMNEVISPSLAPLVVWPLTIASAVRGVEARQQLWFRSELARLGKVIGDGVLEGARNDEWIVL